MRVLEVPVGVVINLKGCDGLRRFASGASEKQSDRRMKWILAAILSLSLVACSQHYDVAELDAGQNCSIFIIAERFYENEQALYYKVEAGGRIVVPRTYISSIEPEAVEQLHLKLVSTNDGSVFGVVEEKLPQKIWLIHNFSSGETWPRCESDTLERCEQRGQGLLKVLQKDHPEIVFTL